MKKKIFSALLVLLVVLGLSNVVMAHGDENTRGPHSVLGLDVAEMIPWMKDMHPNMSDEELNEMYRDCHQNE
ncbi:hypothetical protein GLW08_05080 [Pontibacillus yanchengensis]|uniref:Uncharacterized protein n=2 Tax=Pontibacillus yanchengensis TaxID=462910 RepID=A0ACC7VBF9_9BACI|nr:hypothetical protein [Pontibacillus yanchengensis]MYL32128.1 hypothetical protein [Pontibacillus yanchengensis]MYL52708.1 hypothetical protein [Pontibacillus yanchengensis]